jgi:hypothetical protein
MIKQWVPEDIQDKLWAHTRELRKQAPKGPEAAIFADLEDQFYSGPHISLCILAPVITIERRQKQLFIAVRFNIETTILRYNSKKR